jgi:type I restriction enzyme S subunit
MKWESYKIDDIKAQGKYNLVGGPFGSDLVSKDYVEKGVPVIRGANLPLDKRFSNEDLVFVSEEKAVKLKANIAFPKDIVFTQRGTLGQVGIIPKGFHEEYVVSQSQMKLTVNEEIATPEFVYYYFSSQDGRNSIKAHSITSGVPHINLTILKNLKISLPPVKTQRKIASILSAYDDLIENNLKRIKLLEEATRYSYKQFKKETINEWILGKFSDYFKINNGCAFKAGWYADSGVPIIRTRDYSYSKFLNVGKPIFIDDFQAENFTKFLLKEYDFMLIMVGASIGRYGIILPKDLPALQNQNQWALREINEYSYLKVIKLLLIEEILETLLQQRTGAARDFFRASFLNELEVRVPPEKSGRELNSILENSFNQINVLQKQNTKLREARDILLPKLMNGQIEA